jgi:hypothetical protein
MCDRGPFSYRIILRTVRGTSGRQRRVAPDGCALEASHPIAYCSAYVPGEAFSTAEGTVRPGCDRAIPSPNLLIKSFVYKLKYLLKTMSCCTAQALMPTRLMQVYERSSDYKPILPQPIDLSCHARPSEATPYAYRRQAMCDLGMARSHPASIAHPLCPNLGKCPQFFHPAIRVLLITATMVTSWGLVVQA